MLKRKLKLYKRAKDISTTLISLGFYNIYEYFKLLFGIEVDESVKPQKIREALEKLGASFIKLGQVLSTRPDIVPSEIIQELIKLQDKVPPVPYEKIKEILHRNYGDRLNEIFLYIDREPIASASISQVHIGYLKTGEKVAIKIKRPNLEELINLDTQLLIGIINFLEKHSKTVKELNLKGVINQFKKTTLKEADFSIEAQNIKIFRNNFKNHPYFCIPKVYDDISTKEILVMEFVEGVKVSDTEKLKELGINTKDIAIKLTDAFFKMVFKDGFYHADPHPGNIMILKNKKICLLDFGMVARLTPKERSAFNDYITAVLTFDLNLAMQFYEKLNMLTPKTDIEGLQKDIEVFIEKYYNKRLEDINLKEMVLEVIEIVRENKLRLPVGIAYLGKTAINLEGTVRVLDSSFNPTERLQIFIKKSIGDLLKEKLKESRTALELYYNLIFKTEDIYRQLIRERLTFSIVFKELEDHLEFISNQIKKLSYSILSVGFFMSSALFYVADREKIGNIIFVLGIIFLLLFLYKNKKD
ncbi:MAG: AarF/ABC1/UbiB kinase family protein [Persephonella sp.]|nr:MAG: AarF/ABC1/UbiB kinase family protein [Persephonella sp.]